MPKVVNPDERRRELAEAVWRVIRRGGLAEASVRTVAREADLSTGSLRHYFASQSELLVFAMRLVMERIEARVAAVDRPDDPREAATAVLTELLPLDRERQVERAGSPSPAQAPVQPELRGLRAETYTALWETCERWMRRLLPADAAAENLDLEAHRLFGLLDGLAVHAGREPGALHRAATGRRPQPPPRRRRRVL